MIEIETKTGKRTINIGFFEAFEGWDIQHRFLNFAASQNKDERRAYVMEVLSHASVVIPGAAEPARLQTAALVDNHLGSWQNIQTVFEAVLRKNGIDPETHANKTKFWSEAGAEMAVAFIAACHELIKPALEMAADQQQQ